jgi:hypothetical protein
MNPDDAVSFPTDPYPVRPGTSAVLTARTIDATPQPVLVQAQETVAAAIPRLTATLSDPLFLATLAGTLVLVFLAARMRSRLGPVLLSAMLLMTLTSFRPVEASDEAQPIDDGEVWESESSDDEADDWQRKHSDDEADVPEREAPEWFEKRRYARPTPEPTPFVFRIPIRPDRVRPDLERIRRDREQLREAIEELRLRIEEELRRRGERPYYQTRSARWIRRLAPSVQEWVVVGQHAVADWDWDR